MFGIANLEIHVPLQVSVLLAVVRMSSYLLGRDELQRPEGGLEVGSVALEIVQSTSDAGLELRGVLARGRGGGDLVELRGGHFDCWWRLFVSEERIGGSQVCQS